MSFVESISLLLYNKYIRGKETAMDYSIYGETVLKEGNEIPVEQN